MNDVVTEGPRPRYRTFGEWQTLQAESKAVYAPEGSCATPEGQKAMYQANAHLPLNTATEIMLDKDAPPSARLTAAVIVKEGAHGKVANDAAQVNVQINIAGSPSDDEILARFYASERAQAKVVENEKD